MSVDYLSTLNVGSGLNTTEIIDALVDAERAPAESQITKKREQRTVEISGLGQIKQGFETLNSGLTPATGLTGLVASSTGTALDIEIDDMATAAAFSHSVIVDSVAAGQTLVFDGHAGETASVGTGSPPRRRGPILFAQSVYLAAAPGYAFRVLSATPSRYR